jgi:rhomboid family GlyGly-CTERM serine protease
VSERLPREVGGAGRGPAPLPACGLSIALGALAALVWLLPDRGTGLAYHRDAIAAGELWRLFTGHFVHWSPGHLVWDVGTFLVLGAACEARSRRRFVACLAGSILAIPAAVWLLLPGLELYGGLSGLDSALFALLGAELVSERWQRRSPAALATALVLCLAFALKISFEMTNGGTVFVGDLEPGIVPVPRAHLVGALIGMLASSWGGSSRKGSSGLATAGSCAEQPGSV